MNRYEPWPELGLTIRRLRKQQGLTQGQLAHRADLSTQYISELERDRKNPPLSTLVHIACGLGLGLTEFFREVERQ